MGKEKVDELTFSDDAVTVNDWMQQIREFRRLMQATEQMPMNYFFDVRESVARIRLENTHLEEDELWDLRRSLETIGVIVNFLNKNNGDEEFPEYNYPALRQLAKDVSNGRLVSITLICSGSRGLPFFTSSFMVSTCDCSS